MEDEIQDEGTPYTCQYCGSETREDIVNMALWEGERLVIIADIPARICEKCYEQFYADNTAYKIDKLRANRFPLEKAREVIKVPVFSLTSLDIPTETSQPVKGDNPQGEETPQGRFAGRDVGES